MRPPIALRRVVGVDVPRLGFACPAGIDDVGSLLGVGDGEGAGGGSVPEGFGLAFLVVDGVV